MNKRTHQEVRKAILEILSDQKEHSYGDLERKANTNWITIRTHCKNLQFFKAVIISDDRVKITKQGLDLTKKNC
ncbi:MAG: hypothetical protein KAU20_02975 [Nanoarchaeota archaeon]|nr:hypothetical protein [Nanoarchaeota archaeon]